MQETSALYKKIVATEPHWFETLVTIRDKNGIERALNGDQINEITNEIPSDEYAIFSLDRSRPGMNQNIPSIGGALASTLTTTFLKPSYKIPKMGRIKVYIRAVCEETSGSDTYIVNGVVNGDFQMLDGDILDLGPNASLVNDVVVFSDSATTRLESEWIAAGTYYVDTRANNQSGIDTLDITAFDAMMFAEADYPNTTHVWPYKDTNVVNEIAAQLGVEVDSRTYTFMQSGYMINLPIGYVMREVLEHIAAMYCGNFIITAENKLLLVPLMGLDPEANVTGNYLAEEGTTNALTFGNEGWYILV